MVSLAARRGRRSSEVGWTGRSGHLTGYNFIAETRRQKRRRQSEKAKDNMKDNIMRPDFVCPTLPYPTLPSVRSLCPAPCAANRKTQRTKAARIKVNKSAHKGEVDPEKGTKRKQSE